MEKKQPVETTSLDAAQSRKALVTNLIKTKTEAFLDDFDFPHVSSIVLFFPAGNPKAETRALVGGGWVIYGPPMATHVNLPVFSGVDQHQTIRVGNPTCDKSAHTPTVT